MAATYGYGGEFSSDEDIDKIEHQSERLAQSQAKPNKRQVEEAIDTIKSLPLDEDFNISDELLAGLLDHYKTQRGPIVDSTRNLYKKIALKLIREHHQQATNGNLIQETNGNFNNNNNNNDDVKDNNNSNDIHKKRPLFVEPASSDEDEPMPPVSSPSDVELTRKTLDSRVIHKSSNQNSEPMEVDSETPGVTGIRSNKQADLSSSDEDSETEESSDSEELDITPVKPVVQTPPTVVKVAPRSLTEPPKKTVVSQSDSGRRQPYTRSQRVTTRASSTSAAKAKQAVISSEKVDQVKQVDTTKAQLTGKLSNKSKFRFVMAALVVAGLGVALYYFGSDLSQSTNRILKRTIQF